MFRILEKVLTELTMSLFKLWEVTPDRVLAVKEREAEKLRPPSRRRPDQLEA